MVALGFDATQVAWRRYTADEITPPANDAASSRLELSPSSRKLLDGFTSIPTAYKTQLYSPPGLIGSFAMYTAWVTHRPFLKFAIPATLAALSGIIGRQYKIGGKFGNGTALNFVLAAVSGAGKSDVIGAWSRFCWKASREICPHAAEQPRRVHDQQSASIQAIMDDFIKAPAALWAIEESESMLATITNPKNEVDRQLSEGFRRLWDSGRHDREFSPPKSIRGKAAGEVAIPNISISTFLALPANRFDISDASALDGIFSRMLIIRHKGSSSRLVDPGPRRDLSEQLHRRLVDLIARATELDDLYKAGASDEAFKKLVVIDFSQVDGLIKTLTREIDDLVIKAQDEGSTHVALTRVLDFANRIAGTMAVVENPNMPIVTTEQYQWAFGYVLQNFASILSDFDAGEIGDKASDEESAIKRAIKDLLKKEKDWRKIGGVPKKVLRDHLKHRAPFRTMKERGKVITETLDAMKNNGDLCTITNLELSVAEYWATSD
jgi:hypothetical protein